MMDKAARAALLTAKGMDKKSENIADYVADLLRQGRAKEVTDDLMAQADPQRLHHHYTTGNTGMDMPMDYASRMARAGQMGFNTGNKLYHGSVRDFNSFIPSQSGKVGPGVYMTPNERKAGIFSGYEYDNNPRIEKLLNEGNEKSSQVYGLLATNRPATMEARQAVRTNESAYDDRAEHYRKKFDEMGFDGVSVADERTILDPTNIRSQFARFDPRLDHLAHLSASTGGAMDFARHVEAVTRAGGQIAPSKYLPNVPRAVHADGGAATAPMFQGIHPSLQGENGAPIDLYHGTTQPKEFEAFDNAKLGERDAGFYGVGHYLTPDRETANEYTMAADGDPGEGNIIGPLHTALKNPYIWDVSSDMKAHGTLRDLQSMGIMKDKNELRPWDNLQRHHVGPFMAEMQKRGHDGVVVKTGREDLTNGIAEVVAFNPNTIKHAEAEVFDPNDPRIRRDDGGRVTDTDEFRNWFGNSVTHTNGEPHVFYTGTSKDKDFTSHNVGRHGAWFVRDPEAASSYAEQNDSQGYKREGFKLTPTNTASRVIPAYVKAENPYTGELPEEYLRDNYKSAQSEWFDTLRAKGHDSWVPASQNGNLVVALKEPQQIKSIFNNGKFDPNQKHMNKAAGGRAGYADGGRKLNEHGFYSKALEAAKSMQQAKGTPEQFMAQLKNAKGVKQAELDSIGMPKGDKITQEDFVRHISSNLPRLGMSQLGADPSFLSPEDQKFLRYATNNKNLTPEEDEKRRKLDQRRMRNIGHSTDDEGNSETIYPDYITPGGSNYRERLIKLTGDKQYQSSHWDDANVLAHVRMHDRVVGGGRDEMRPVIQKLADHLGVELRDLGSGSADVGVKNGVISPEEAATLSRLMRWQNGYESKKGVDKKLLHVEEIQSDWGQEGRKDGFHDPKNPYEVVRKDTKEVVSRHPDYASMWDAYRTHPDADNLTYGDVRNEKPPEAPFVQNTQHWTDLAMKNILREAALGDYDGIVFTPGQAQADRYGLDKKVQSLSLSRPQDGSKFGRLVARDVFGGTIHNSDIADEKELHGLIGKDMGEKLLSASPVANSDDQTLNHQLEGDDLKMGGEGMKNYYDKIVPKSAMNLVRQHDPSAQPQSMNINGEYDALHIPLSSTAKDSIEKNGFQMFKRGGVVDAAIAATRRFTKNGIGATMSLKPRGK